MGRISASSHHHLFLISALPGPNLLHVFSLSPLQLYLISSSYNIFFLLISIFPYHFFAYLIFFSSAFPTYILPISYLYSPHFIPISLSFPTYVFLISYLYPPHSLITSSPFPTSILLISHNYIFLISYFYSPHFHRYIFLISYLYPPHLLIYPHNILAISPLMVFISSRIK